MKLEFIEWFKCIYSQEPNINDAKVRELYQAWLNGYLYALNLLKNREKK